MFPPSRIVCLTEETVETLYLLGEQDRLTSMRLINEPSRGSSI
jgi:ABC-type hemin transport system substrate-binding protein